MLPHTSAITPEQARSVLGESIVTDAPRFTERSCVTRRHVRACRRAARLDSAHTCRSCER